MLMNLPLKYYLRVKTGRAIIGPIMAMVKAATHMSSGRINGAKQNTVPQQQFLMSTTMYAARTPRLVVPLPLVQLLSRV